MAFAAGQILTADDLNTLDAQDTWTPTLHAHITDPTLGTGATQSGWYHRNGGLITGGAIIVLGTGSTDGSGILSVSVPFDIDVSILTSGGGGANASVIGSMLFMGVTDHAGSVYVVDSQHIRMRDANNMLSSDLQDETRISLSFSYLADPAGLP